MKIFFLSGLYPKGSEDYYQSNHKHGILQAPSNVYQWGVVNGLIENGVDVEVCSFPFLPVYPLGYTKMSSMEESIICGKNIVGKAYRYCTLIGIKEFDIIIKARKIIRNWVKKIASDDIGVILIYSAYGPFFRAAVSEAKKRKNIKVCPILTDLFISSPSVLKDFSVLKKIQGYIEYCNIQHGLQGSDTFVLLAKGMTDFVPQSINNYVIIEGIAGDTYQRPLPKKQSVIKTLLYTGSLGIHTNIKELVDAFMQTTNENFRLIICGTGYYKQYIEQQVQKDSRIVYKGIVSREEAVCLQRTATLLINPRLSSIPDTPYSFPSKTIEYLVSGTPMIGYRLAGITEDYYDHFFIPQDEKKESLTLLLNEVLLLPQKLLDYKADKSWNFIVRNKNAKSQMRKLIDFLESKFEK